MRCQFKKVRKTLGPSLTDIEYEFEFVLETRDGVRDSRPNNVVDLWLIGKKSNRLLIRWAGVKNDGSTIYRKHWTISDGSYQQTYLSLIEEKKFITSISQGLVFEGIQSSGNIYSQEELDYFLHHDIRELTSLSLAEITGLLEWWRVTWPADIETSKVKMLVSRVPRDQWAAHLSLLSQESKEFWSKYLK